MGEELCAICYKGKASNSCKIDKTDSGMPYLETIHVCKECLDDSVDNFIFLCINCHKSYKRNKGFLINRLLKSKFEDTELAKGLMLIGSEGIIMGISSCVSCDKEHVWDNVLEDTPIIGNA